MPLKISLIAAMAKNRVIGKDGNLPWKLPEDLKYFQAKTLGHIIIMGRKTFDEIKKPLKNRENIVITRQPNYTIEGAHVFSSLDEALSVLKKRFENETKEIFIVGGQQIYQLALPFADYLYLTEIDQEFEGDTYFPEYDTTQFEEISRDDRHSGPIPFSFIVYQRKFKS